MSTTPNGAKFIIKYSQEGIHEFKQFSNGTPENLNRIAIKEVIDTLKEEKEIKTLTLSKNDLGNQEIVALAKAIQDNSIKLISLDLSCNKISDEGLSAISQLFLENNQTIIKLDLSNNNISNQVFFTIIANSAIIKKEVHFDLSNNKINDLLEKDTDGIMYVIKQLPNETKVNLSGNDINNTDSFKSILNNNLINKIIIDNTSCVKNHFQFMLENIKISENFTKIKESKISFSDVDIFTGNDSISSEIDNIETVGNASSDLVDHYNYTI